jgi:hypothetical protein
VTGVAVGDAEADEEAGAEDGELATADDCAPLAVAALAFPGLPAPVADGRVPAAADRVLPTPAANL